MHPWRRRKEVEPWRWQAPIRESQVSYGFYPAEFERKFFKRVGPSVTLEGEENDEDKLLDIMIENELRTGS